MLIVVPINVLNRYICTICCPLLIYKPIIILIIIFSQIIYLLSILTNNLTTLNIPDLNKKIMYQCSNKLSLDYNIFSKLDCNSSILERPHKMILISLLINRYLSVRLKSFGKHYSALVNTTSKRHKFNKLILFSNH